MRARRKPSHSWSGRSSALAPALLLLWLVAFILLVLLCALFMAITLFRAVACSMALLSVILTAIPQVFAAGSSTLNDELLVIDEQLLDARNQLLAVAEQLREAKQVVTEKHNEVASFESALAREASALASGHLHHAKQRLALAKMGVDTSAAKFERIQRKMEDLAAARIQLLASRDNQVSLNEPLRPHLLITAVAEDDEVALPVLEVQGKLVDPVVVEATLQKLEQYLVTAAVPHNIAINAKAFGSTIDGEIALSALGGNQFFTRFTVRRNRSQVVAGARLGHYVRTRMDLAFSAEEMGREFILLLDVNSAAEPRAVVFDSALMPAKEALAVSQRF